MGKKPTIWVVDDDESIRWVLEQALKDAGYAVISFAAATTLPDLLKKKKPDVLVTDIRMPGLSGLDLLANIQEHCPELPVIVMTAFSDLDSAVSAYSSGAFEYLPKPFDIDEALNLVERALAQNARNQVAIESGENISGQTMIGEAPAMQEVFRAIGRLSRASLNVLIIGESGTGKELVARALHQHGARASGPFVDINTAAIPADLLESELFGHEKGAFTGAVTQRAGRFEQANGGTLFLDEIGEMPAELQTRLLRVLAEGKFYRVGGRNQVSVDVRIVAATNRDLEQRVEEGHFREDLYHRLNVVRIDVPPLRERREDIPALANFFLRQAARELNLEDKKFAPETLDHMRSFNWSGNVRQLQNVCNWLMVMAPGQVVGEKDLPPELREGETAAISDQDWREFARSEAKRRLAAGNINVMTDMVADMEQTLIEAALEATRGRKQDAAHRLGLGRNTLTRKLKQYNIENGE